MVNKLKDSLNFMRRLNVKRIQNLFVTLISYYSSRAFKKEYHGGLPLSIAIEPTTSCNLRCPECPSGLRQFSRATGMLELKTFQRIINEVKDHSWFLTLYFQGEPYLNPEFHEFVKYSEGNNIYTATSTNAHYLTETNAEKTVLSGLSRLIISIDGTTQETYEQYRIGGKINKVLEGTRNVVAARKKLNSATPYLIFQFLVVRPNEHQVSEIEKMAREIGVDEVKFKTAQVYDYEDGNPLIPENERFSRYKKGKNGKFSIKGKLLNHCWRMWSGCVFTWDGDVVPCCFDKDAKYKMGNINEVSFGEIWNNKRYRDFRAAILRSRKEIDICSNCTEGTKVWA